METANIESPRFSMKQAKELVRDLHHPIAWVYWTDFLGSILIGHTLFALNVNSDAWLQGPLAFVWSVRTALFLGTVFLFLRSAMFTHELVHLPKQGWNAFRIAWNVLCGIPFMIPSFTYYPHIDHHRRKSYGTEDDAEYLNLSHQPPISIVVYLLGTLITPFVGLIRFGVMSPIAWVFPQVRKWTFKHASTMVMDITYERPEGTDRVYRIMLMQEIGCFFVCVGIVLHAPFVAQTWLDPLWIHAYLVSVSLLMLNNLRTLGAHRWTGTGAELTMEQQLLDSCDYPSRPWITELWGPTGTRYHATHHLFPSLPYHNLGIAHRRLMAGLPQNSIFRETVRTTLIGEIASLWRRSIAASKSTNRTTAIHHRSETNLSDAA
ncbi:MAG: fatty acid desaturase [Pirellula sp.]